MKKSLSKVILFLILLATSYQLLATSAYAIDTPTGFKLSETGSTTAEISWNPVNGATSYAFTYSKVNGATRSLNTQSTKVILDNYNSSDSFTVKVSACNKDGCSTPGTYQKASSTTPTRAAAVNSVSAGQPTGGSSINIPGFGIVTGLTSLNPQFTNLGSLLSAFLNLFFTIAIFLAFFWGVWGAFQYIFAGGDKNSLANARKRIIWAVVGLIITAISFLLAQAIEEIFPHPIKSPISLITTAYAAGPVNIGDEYGFGQIKSLGQATNYLIEPAFMIAGAALVFYFVIGAFRYIMSGGNKEAASSARAMITHGVIGFILLMLIFLIIEIVPEILGVNFTIFNR